MTTEPGGCEVIWKRSRGRPPDRSGSDSPGRGELARPHGPEPGGILVDLRHVVPPRGGQVIRQEELCERSERERHEKGRARSAPRTLLPPGRDRRKREERGRLGQEARAEAVASPPLRVSGDEKNEQDEAPEGGPDPARGPDVETTAHQERREQEEVREEDQEAPARAEEDPGQPRKSEPPGTDAHVQETVPAEGVVIEHEHPG